MIGITEEMLSLIRESIMRDDGSEFIPVVDMDGYFVSRAKHNTGEYRYMFSVDVDGKEIHVFIKL